ncbi:hypothetical protein [Streptomyces inhibens]|uniref:hypothetical protein n=1 Tax=Streptomyces inhibens TaxID=2293571 RepID=UPI001EE6BD26|nr:hypothetical protein [Streptomyces inhibens]UKY55367.1 hypothetical protein KI385_27950 [Streptomyces inhibens]
MKGGGQARWNKETQSWEDGTPPPAPYTGPMPPRPAFAPSTGTAPGAPEGVPPGTAGPGPYPAPLLAPEHEPVPGVRRRTALVAGAAVAVIAAACGGAYLLWGNSGDDPAAARPPSGTKAAASAATDATAPTDATGDAAHATGGTATGPSTTELPDGYRLVHDDGGFTTAVPSGWQRSERNNSVFYTAPDERGLVQIYKIREPDTPRQSLQKTSEELSRNPGYEEISLGPLDGPAPGQDATQLVYAYDNKSIGERVKVVDCAFTVADGRRFTVLVRGTEADWPEQERTQQIALQAFAPTG